MNLKKIIRLLISLSLVVLTYCTSSKPTDPNGNLPGDDDNLYLITNDGDLNHLSADTIDAEYNTFFFTSNESYRKFYLGGKLPNDGINYNSIRLIDPNIYLSPGKIVNFGSSDINNSYYSLPIEATDIPTVFFGSIDYDINLEVGVEDVTANPPTFMPKRTDKIKFKVGAPDYRDWGLNVYQQLDYNSLDLTKANIVSSFDKMNVSFGSNAYRIYSQAADLRDTIIDYNPNPTNPNTNPINIYAYNKIYPNITVVSTAIITYFAEHPNEGLLFFVKDYNPLSATSILTGTTLDDNFINGQFKLNPISMVFVQRIRDLFNSTYWESVIKHTTIHELGHLWCGGLTDTTHMLWHNGNNKNYCLMKTNIHYPTPTSDDQKILSALTFCEGHLQRGMNVSWKLKQYSPYGENTSTLNSELKLYASNSTVNYIDKNNLEIEIICNKNEIIQGELIDILVKLKNKTNKTIITGAPKHFLHFNERDTSITIGPGNAHIEIPPYGTYSYFIDPLGYIGYNEEIFPGYPWYYWFEGKYEYSIAHFVGDEKFISNKIQIKVNPVPDSLQSSFNELKEDIKNPAVINFATYKSEKLELLAEKNKNSFYKKEFYYKLLSGYNYYEAIGNKGGGAKYLRERAINLYKNFILKYPNSDASYTFFTWMCFNYSDNMFLLDEIITSLKKTDPNCWLLEALNNQPDYMFKEIKHLLK